MYASNNALFGKGIFKFYIFLELSRRDDIESLIYILIFCLKGTLPWKGVLKLDFLKSEKSKEMITKWRDSNGELC